MKTLLFALLLSLGLTATAADAPLSALLDKETVDTLATLPVQEGGRHKPLDTLARYRLLRFSGKRTIAFENPETKKKEYLSAIKWLVVTWFRPDLGKDMPVFVLDNSAAAAELGIDVSKKGKRDRYSYNELLPGRQTLMSKMREYQEVDSKKRTAVQSMIANLGVNFLDYEMIATHFDFARKPIGENAWPEDIIKAGQTARTSELLPKAMAYLKLHPEAAAPMQNPWMMDLMRNALGAMMSGNQELSLRIFPPPAKDIEPWHGPGWIIMGAVQGKEPTAADLNWLRQYEDIYLSASDPAKFKASVKSLATQVEKAAAERGEAQYVKLEASYLRADYFYYALCLFFLGLILLAITWASPAARWAGLLRGGVWLSLGTATVLSVVGIVIRCIIMQRPPITTLYETIIFITATAALFGLIAEVLTRKHLGLLIAAVSGTAGMFLSIRFETMEGQDTMQQLQAVLITNFWLATHVPLINLGYSAAMVAAILSMVYFIKRLIGSLKGGDDNARSLTRMAYGFIGAGLFLSLVGTILGGIWANYSWGRFWGWDPKENGALMIVLMCLIILHARLGGYIREIGLHACNLVLGMITVFSWFGVNQLGVGLHAYGFTDGVWFWLSMYWGTQCLFLLAALGFWWKERSTRRALKSSGKVTAAAA
jgi:ABC-type transport system involved in cytochrome c biogenesis permease subunit